jgi:hypothetical protein
LNLCLLRIKPQKLDGKIGEKSDQTRHFPFISNTTLRT